MHLVRYLSAEATSASACAVATASCRRATPTCVRFIEAGDGCAGGVRAGRRARAGVDPQRILAPIDNPGKMFFLGMTYDVVPRGCLDRAGALRLCAGPELDRRAGATPSAFPSEGAHVLYEGELVVVIGEPIIACRPPRR